MQVVLWHLIVEIFCVKGVFSALNNNALNIVYLNVPIDV